MTTTEQSVEHTGKHTTEDAPAEITDGVAAIRRDDEAHALSERARRHLWMHFSNMGTYSADVEVPVMVRGEGAYVYDSRGNRYLDGLSGLFTSQLGHGRTDIAEAAARQASQLGYFPLWTYAHPPAIELAEKLASLTPGDLNHVFFTSGGSEAVESAWKLARQYHRVKGEHDRYKVISRDIAYHGTTLGALTITSVTPYRTPFEPLVPGAIKVPNTNRYRAPEHRDDPSAFGTWSADQIEAAILREGPETVAAVFLEPVQNAGGCFTPPPGYFQAVREVCDRYGVLFVSDEVICAFGRLGTWFGGQKYEYVPDMITCAKGMTSGYAPLGALLVNDRVAEPFFEGGHTFLHGLTFAGHPVSCAVALKSIEIFETEHVLEHVSGLEGYLRDQLEALGELPIVGDVRGAGFFWGIELVRDQATRETFEHDEAERLLRGFVSPELFRRGLICRSDDRGDPVVQVAPPLICEKADLDFMVGTLREVLAEASTKR
jgi:adenosylmethionine-8-amino-7-oxononanoate aminotransferase